MKIFFAMFLLLLCFVCLYLIYSITLRSTLNFLSHCASFQIFNMSVYATIGSTNGFGLDFGFGWIGSNCVQIIALLLLLIIKADPNTPCCFYKSPYFDFFQLQLYQIIVLRSQLNFPACVLLILILFILN